MNMNTIYTILMYIVLGPNWIYMWFIVYNDRTRLKIINLDGSISVSTNNQVIIKSMEMYALIGFNGSFEYTKEFSGIS
uniref:Uncharacterized protein n=1 Tax=Lepeophtheirus salmonis TaxID=72036 RepID=A0A0K2T0W6_LEPSM